MYYNTMYEAEEAKKFEYNQYLDSLIEKGDYDLYALNIAIDLLSTHSYKTSGKSAIDFLSDIKTNMLRNSKKDLPF